MCTADETVRAARADKVNYERRHLVQQKETARSRQGGETLGIRRGAH